MPRPALNRVCLLTSIRPSVRRGAIGLRTQIAIVVSGLCAVMVLAAWFCLSGREPDVGPVLVKAQVGEYVHVAKVSGVLDSLKEATVECEVDYLDGWNPMILEVVEEGTFVEKGDLLVRLETSKIDDMIRIQKAKCLEYDAKLVAAEQRLALAHRKLDEYRDGEYGVAWSKSSSKLANAKFQLEQAEKELAFAESLYRKGHFTEEQVEAEQFAYEKAKNAFEAAQVATTVLETVSREKQLKEFESEIAAAEASVETWKRITRVGAERLAQLHDQLKDCEVYAPTSGYVVLAHLHHHGHSHWIRVGEKTRPGRTLVRLPDPRRMRVICKVDEKEIGYVEQGQPASIRLEASPGAVLTGKVIRVNEYPDTEDDFGGVAVKRFRTEILIDSESVDQADCFIRPGLNADVEIIVDRRDNQLQVPMQAVIEHQERKYCFTNENGRLQPRQVRVGPGNGSYLVIESGVEEGEEVVLASNAYRDMLEDLPAVPLEPTTPVEEAASVSQRNAARTQRILSVTTAQ